MRVTEFLRIFLLTFLSNEKKLPPPISFSLRVEGVAVLIVIILLLLLHPTLSFYFLMNFCAYYDLNLRPCMRLVMPPKITGQDLNEHE